MGEFTAFASGCVRGPCVLEKVRVMLEAAGATRSREARTTTESGRSTSDKKMTPFDQRTAKVLVTILAFVAAGWFLYGVRHTLVVILFAIFFAYLLEPLVQRMEHSRLALHSRRLAIFETYIICAALITVLIVIFGGRISDDARRLTHSLPQLLENVTSGKIVWQFGSKHGWSEETEHRIEQFIAQHQHEILGWTGEVGAAIAESLQNVVWILLVPLLAVFFLLDGRQFAETFLRAFDDRGQRRFLRGIIDDLNRMLSHFILSQLVLAAISLVIYAIMLTACRFPYALVLALAGGAMEFVPTAGPLMAALVMLTVGFLAGYPHLLLIALLLGLWRITQDYVVSPRVLGNRLALHPLSAITAVLMGGELGGVLGVYLSIPAAATLRIVWLRWQHYAATEEPVPITVVRS